MTIYFLTVLGLASSVSIAHGESDFNKLRSIIDRLESDARELTNAYNDKDAEAALLLEQLSACQQGCSSEPPCITSFSADTFNSASGTEPDSSSSGLTTTGTEHDDTSDDVYYDEDDDATDDFPTYTLGNPSSTVGALDHASTTATSTSHDSASSPRQSFSWVPRVGDTWNYNLASPVDTDVDADVFAIDMDAGQDIINELHDKGKAVSCYISVGTAESWRDDYDDFPASAIGNTWDEWEGENWLDINNQGVKDIMVARVQKAATMNCDAIEPDNMMVYTEKETGLDISEGDQIEYNMWFAETVHANGMRCAMKNAVELIPIIGSVYDFAINEECHEWDECGAYNEIFLEQGKPVFNVEYDTGLDICAEANAQGLDTIMKNYNLKPALCSCADPSRDMDCNDVQ